MNTTRIAAASLLALSALGGSAFAAGAQPVAGEGPFATPAALAAARSRTDVAAEARRTLPAAGEQTAAAPAAVASPLTRAAVRDDVRAAIRQGHAPATGELNG